MFTVHTYNTQDGLCVAVKHIATGHERYVDDYAGQDVAAMAAEFNAAPEATLEEFFPDFT